jgi:hypothetical protein
MPTVTRSETEVQIEREVCGTQGHALAMVSGPQPFLLCQRCAKIFNLDGILTGPQSVVGGPLARAN